MARPLPASVSSALIAGAGAVLFAASAQADVNLELANGDKVLGTLSPGSEIETFRFVAPADAVLTVTVSGKKAKGAPAAPVVGFDLVDPDDQTVAPVHPASGPAKLKKFPLPAYGEWKVRVSGDGVVGDYSLKISWVSRTKVPIAGDLGDGDGTFEFSADRSAVGKFTVSAKDPDTAPVLVGIERLDPELIADFTPPAEGASKHVVKGVPLSEGGDFTLTVTGEGGRYAGSVKLKPPKTSRRKIRITTAILGDDPDDSFAGGEVIGPEGGVVSADDFGSTPIDGASVDIPEGALELPTAIVIGTGTPLPGQESDEEGAGPTVTFSPEGQQFGEAVTVTVPFDPAPFGGDFTALRIYTKDKNGKVSLVDPSTYVIDPLAGTVSFPSTHFSSYRAFGKKAPKRGDLDGDGFADLVVGAPGASGNTGRVLIFRGSSAFFAAKATDAAVVLPGGAAGDLFGVRVASGDVNGDGFADVCVATGGSSAGIHVFLGRADFFSQPPTAPNSKVTPGTADVALGSALAVVDVTRDGVADLVVSDSQSSYNSSGAGAVYVVLGGTAFGTISVEDRAVLHYWGESTDDAFGASVGVGDVDADGFADLAVGAPQINRGNLGRAYVFAAGRTLKDAAASSAPLFTGEELGDAFGTAVAIADLDEDGIDDLVVGSPGADPIGGPQGIPIPDAGAVYLFLGTATFSGRGAASADLRFAAKEEQDARRGHALAVGNLTGNATKDLLVGVPGSSAGLPNAGGVYLGRGRRAFDFADERIDGALQDEALGFTLLPPVDLDGDGRDESILVGPFANLGNGRIEVRFGPGLFSRTMPIGGGFQDNLGGDGL